MSYMKIHKYKKHKYIKIKKGNATQFGKVQDTKKHKYIKMNKGN